MEEADDPSSIQRFIVVDKKVLLEFKSLSSSDAFISLLSVLYALNLQYNSNHMAMFKFIKEHIGQIEYALLSKFKDKLFKWET